MLKRLIWLAMISLVCLSACLPVLPRSGGRKFASKETKRLFKGEYQHSDVEIKMIYRGKDLQSLSVQMTLPVERINELSQDLSTEELEAALGEMMQANPEYAELQGIEGLTANFEIMPDKTPRLILDIDAQTLDMKKASNSRILEKMKLLDLWMLHPKKLSQLMKDRGYIEEKS